MPVADAPGKLAGVFHPVLKAVDIDIIVANALHLGKTHCSGHKNSFADKKTHRTQRLVGNSTMYRVRSIAAKVNPRARLEKAGAALLRFFACASRPRLQPRRPLCPARLAHDTTRAVRQTVTGSFAAAHPVRNAVRRLSPLRGGVAAKQAE